MTNLPTWETYGNYSSANYGVHALRFFDAAGNCYWFSYSTLVAFSKPGHPRVVRQNDWSVTTGRHLNRIDGGAKKDRLTAEAFHSVFKEYFGKEIAA